MTSFDRRTFLHTSMLVTGAGLLGACTHQAPLVRSGDPRIQAVEATRRSTGQVRHYTLNAAPGRIDLGGMQVDTWAFNQTLPGPEIRVRKGDTIEARLVNQLPHETSIHWHGMALRNDMDGVPVLTQQAVAAGATFTYRFIADTSGTFWFHPHVGVHLDRGLYAPLIIEDPDEPARYDHDWTVVVDDWIDGVGGQTPDKVLEGLRGMAHGDGSAGHSGHGGGQPAPAMTDGPAMIDAKSDLLGGDAGDVKYPYHLINGRIATNPATFTARPRQRARVRFVNAGGDTAYRVALGGHRMTITHTDGFPVRPAEADSFLLGMGERVDVVVTLASGVFPLVALAEGKDATGLALIRTGAGNPPPATIRPKELNGKLVGYTELTPEPSVLLPEHRPDVEHKLELTGGEKKYEWTINGDTFDPEKVRYRIREGQRARVTFINKTTMWHPMHIHGHTFQINGKGPRKDTVNVLPNQTVTCDFDANNPGQWMTHCHNIYHAETGMQTTIGYEA